jgi:hypothetical protein
MTPADPMHTFLELTGLRTLARCWAWIMEPMIFNDPMGGAPRTEAGVRQPVPASAAARVVTPVLPVPAIHVRRWSPPAPRCAGGPLTRHHALALSG